MNAVFDTLAYANRLKKVGVDEKQAEVQVEILAEIIESNLATKRDLKELETTFKHDIKALEMSLTLRLGAIMVGGITIIVTLVKLL